MAEEWFVRVQGREYGPVDFETLREWKKEGRVLPANEVRKTNVDPAAAAASAEEAVWTTAAEIPGLFAPVPVSLRAEETVPSRSLGEILVDTWRIYSKGFFQFLCLSALVVVPSVCGQLSSAAIGPTLPTEIDMRTFLAAMFNLCMQLVTLAAWPVYIAGIQILTSELAAGRQVAVLDLIQRALKFWQRVLGLWIFVRVSYFFGSVLPLLIIFMLLLSGPSLLAIFLTLVLLTLQVWLTGRLFINFMFWQQFAVLRDCTWQSALQRSKELARGRRDVPWFKRPLWRGVFLASLWFGFVLLLNSGQLWSALHLYFQEVATTADPQVLLQSMREHAQKSAGFSSLTLGLWLVQKILQPLLGIAFVLLYFDSNKGG